MSGCREDALKKSQRLDAGSEITGLGSAQAQLVLARVDGRVITLGDLAATLERMDQFDRLRYQTPERRRKLLDELVNVELLAAEAQRRGLDKTPETEEALRQVLRDAVLNDVRKGVKAPGEIPETAVRAYYEAHKDDFEDPERRRVAHIAVKDKAKALKVIEEAKKASAIQWGELVLNHSANSPPKPYKGPMEMLGDLGIVGPAQDPRGANPRVPNEIRDGVFRIEKIGDVLDQPVQTADGLWHVVRLVGKTDAHARSFAEAERTVRITMVQKEIQQTEKALSEDLRNRFKVQIDEAALSRVHVPATPPEAAPSSSAAHSPDEP